MQTGLGASLAEPPSDDVVDAGGVLYRKAMSALAASGRDAQQAVTTAAILDRQTLNVFALRRGLSALADHFRMTTRELTNAFR